MIKKNKNFIIIFALTLLLCILMYKFIENEALSDVTFKYALNFAAKDSSVIAASGGNVKLDQVIKNKYERIGDHLVVKWTMYVKGNNNQVIPVLVFLSKRNDSWSADSLIIIDH